mgnify:CR=1 FL=1
MLFRSRRVRWCISEIMHEVSQGLGENEEFLVLDLGMNDMKMETLIQTGTVNDNMVALLKIL